MNCKYCKKYFQEDYKYLAYENTTNQMIKGLLKEDCGIRSISRVLKISKQTILSRMLKISQTINYQTNPLDHPITLLNLNIGKYIAIKIIPTRTPTIKIINGSIIVDKSLDC